MRPTTDRARVAAIIAGAPSTRPPWWADLSLLATTIIWGVNIPLFKYSISRLDPWVFNGLRLTCATLALGALAWWESRHRVRSSAAAPQATPGPGPIPAGSSPNSAERDGASSTSLARRVGIGGRLLLFAVVSNLVYQWVFVLGIRRTTSGNTALLMASMPMWTALISLLFIGERLRGIAWLGLATTFLGAGMITLSRGDVDISAGHLFGNLLVLGASILWAIGTVLSRRLLRRMSALRLAFLASLTTLPAHLVVAALAWTPESSAALTPTLWGAIVFSGAMSTGLAYALWHVGVSRLGASHASVYQNVVTLVAVAGGWLWLAEQPTWPQLAGGLLTMVGMVLMRRGR